MTKKKIDVESSPASRLILLLAIVSVVVLGLVFMWKQFPFQQPPSPSPSAILPTSTSALPASKEKTTCENAGGKWTECGSPCHGSPPGTICAQVCEPQCLCGGASNWTCPTDETCINHIEDQNSPSYLVGICRPSSSQEAIDYINKVNSSVRDFDSSPDIDQVRERPAGSICDATNSICVNASYQDMLLASPFTVTGTAVAFEQQFSWRLEDANGVKLEEGSAMTHAPDAGIPGPFTIRSFILTVPKTATGTLFFFEASPKDGSETHVVRVSVRLPQQAQAVTLVCDGTWPVQIVKTASPIEATLRKLFEHIGIAPLISVSLQQGVLTVKLVVGPAPSEGLVTCIEETAKQFPAVKSVQLDFGTP